MGGSEVEIEVPCLDFTKDPENMIEGSEGWKDLCKKVKDAIEEYGVFTVVYDKVPAQLHEDLFRVTKEVFELPKQTKMKNVSNTNRHSSWGYLESDELPSLYESLAIEDAPILENTQAFTQLMWPEGNPEFCKTVNSMMSKMHELELVILKMIMESYGLGKYYDSYVESNNCLCRLMKYTPPKNNKAEIALPAHVDMNVMSMLCQNSVQGLEIKLREDHWTKVSALPGQFIVFIGDSLRVWSNGRIRSTEHRVTIKGDKMRYTTGVFITPKERVIVEAPKELIDEEHPQSFRPFAYREYFDYIQIRGYTNNSLVLFAGI